MLGKRRTEILAAAVALLLASGAVQAVSPPYLVKDINTGEDPSAGSTPDGFGVSAGVAYFAATSGGRRQLWRSDGTAEGTWRVADVAPNDISAAGDLVYFAGDDGQTGPELWRSDGTADGTFQVADLCPPERFPACLGSAPEGFVSPSGDDVVFSAFDGVHGRAPWRTDGTAAGTFLLADIRVHTAPYGGSEFVVLDGLAYFLADDEVSGTGLWRTDGTVAGTLLVKDLDPQAGPPFPSAGLVVLDGAIWFTGYDQVHGLEPWRSDGTPEGTRVLDLAPGLGSAPRGFVSLGGRVFFAGFDELFSPVIWSSDGSSEGTSIAVHLQADGVNLDIKDLFTFAGHLYFTAVPSSSYGVSARLWRVDDDGAPRPLQSQGPVKIIGVAGDRILFVGTDPTCPPREGCRALLWASGGTPETTAPVTFPGSPPHPADTGSSIAIGGDSLLFAADDDRHGLELWRTDGSAAGTSLVANIEFRPGWSSPAELTPVAGRLGFTAVDDSGERHLWITDGTEGGTRRLENFAPAVPDGPIPSYLTASANRLYFAAQTTPAETSLWRTDGAPDSTVLLRGYSTGYLPRPLATAGDSLYFSATDDPQTPQLWVSDGEPAGTRPIVAAEVDFRRPDIAAVVGDTLFFAGYDEARRSALWRSDGTAAGTALVKSTKSLTAAIEYLTAADPALFFFTIDGLTLSQRLWTSDGTSDATGALIEGFSPGGASLPGFYVTSRASTFANAGNEPWSAYVGGARLLGDVAPGPASSDPFGFTRVGDRVYFVTSAPDRSHESLWLTDGTPQGTRLVRDLDAGVFASNQMMEAGGRLFFATNRLAGDSPIFELWESDGSEQGTRVATQLPDSEYYTFTPSGSHIYFTLQSPAYGLELWAVDVTEAACAGDCNGDGRTTDAEILDSVRLALAGAGRIACPLVDRDDDARVTVDEIVAGVASAAGACAATTD